MALADAKAEKGLVGDGTAGVWAKLLGSICPELSSLLLGRVDRCRRRLTG